LSVAKIARQAEAAFAIIEERSLRCVAGTRFESKEMAGHSGRDDTSGQFAAFFGNN
jgi:hypothetical protein